MRRLFSVSMPRAGHHVAEMVLGRLLGPRFGYCEFYTVRSCCKRIPCDRMAARAEAGTLAFLQKSHDHDLADPAAAAFDGILVQVREPVARALSNYELDLTTVGPAHSAAYMRFWLGLEAAYTIGFIRKWCISPDPRSLVLSYEHLLADPVTYYRSIFERFRLPMTLFDEAKVLGAQAVSSGDKRPFRERDIRASRHYDETCLAAFQSLVTAEAERIGYAPHPQLSGGGSLAAIELAFQARQRQMAGDPEGAIATLGAYLKLPDAHAFGRQMRAHLLLARGDAKAAEADLTAVIAAEPRHPRAFLDLAKLQQKRGDAAAARQTVERCLAQAADPARAAAWILDAFTDPALTEAAQRHAPAPALTREDVVAAFRFILGRDPEGEAVIEAHQKAGSHEALRRILLRSGEFAEKYRKLAAEPGG